MYKLFIRPILFLFDPEAVHNFLLGFLSRATLLYPFFRYLYSPKSNGKVKINELMFRNRLGLAAGFDKNGIAIRFWEAIGFSHVEVGTVTPLPQTGSEKPRIFRLEKDKALINRLGFNNKGADEAKKNIMHARKFINSGFIIGVNIGKNKNTSIKDASEDYRTCFEKLYDAADYFTLNISSPNTQGLRMLHEEHYLDNLLSEIQKLNAELSSNRSIKPKCIFLKIAPDLNPEMIDSIYRISLKNDLTAIIATNTTVERRKIKTRINEEGGLSGKPLKPMSDAVLKRLNELNTGSRSGKLLFTGVGGVFDRKDFEDKIKLGAYLVQVYTGFIYEGPSIIKKIIQKK